MSQEKRQIGRVTRSKQEARTSYDKMAGYYDWMSARFEKKYRDFAVKKLDVQKGERVLEIGPGTGHGIEAFAQSVGSAGKVYGIDISEGMLRVARARVARAGGAQRVALGCGDAANLPLKSNLVHAVFMSFTLELFDTPEIPAVLGECYRVLQHGGRLVVLTMAKTDPPNVMTRLYEWAHDRFPKAIDCRPIRAQGAIQEAGFELVERTTHSLFTIPLDILVARKAKTT